MPLKVDILGMENKKKNFFNFTNTIGRFIVLALVILFLINIGRSIYKNHDIKKQINNLEDQITALENENLNLKNRILYYETPIYKEIEARRHLGYKKKGENVVSLLSKDNVPSEEENIKNENSQSKPAQDESIPNWQKWIKYIFG